MNLAAKDIRHKFGRFIVTTAGMSLLLVVVMGMGGIYRGLVQESILIIDSVDADIWVVQRDTKGPFGEISLIPRNMEERIAAIEGVESASPFVSHTIQRDYRGRVLRLTVQGLPDDGSWLPLIEGRPLRNAHYEMLANKSAKLPLGTQLKLCKNVYTVVGITDKMTSPAGDAMIFVSVNDAISIRDDVPGEATRLEREARVSRYDKITNGSTQPENADIFRNERPVVLPGLRIGAVLVKVRPDHDIEEIRRKIEAFPDVTAYTADEQRAIMLSGIVVGASRQLNLFRIILIVVSSVVMTLILFTLTLDKLHDIAMLKLLGARNRMIVWMILQQALLIGCLSFALACFLGSLAYPHFPRLVVIVRSDQLMLFGGVIIISVLSSLAGVRKAIRTDVGEVLS